MEKPINCICMPSSSFFAVMLLHLIKVLSSGCKFVDATDTLLPGQSLSGNQTLLSKSGAFELGFQIQLPISSMLFGFYIWHINSSTCSPLLVWEPDAVSPNLPFHSSFGLSRDGSLYLTDDGSDPFWSSSDTKIIPISALAILLDNGNLVIRDQRNISMVFWQSFDNPDQLFWR